tara:strand:+ start:20416 stop:26811 length:6396 start_codon:yes stop_codon:yes gene_type:complete
MYEYNGKLYSLAELQQAAQAYEMEFDAYLAQMQSKGLKEIEYNDEYTANFFQQGLESGPTKENTESQSDGGFSGVLKEIINSPVGQNYIIPGLRGIGNPVGGPVQAITNIAFENVGKPAAKEVGRGFVGAFDAITQPDEPTLSEENIGIGYAATRGLIEDPRGFFNNAVEALPKFADTSLEMVFDNMNDLKEMGAIYGLSWYTQYKAGKSKLSANEKRMIGIIAKQAIKAQDKLYESTGLGPLGAFSGLTSRENIDKAQEYLKGHIKQHNTTITEEIAKGMDADWATIGGRIFADGIGSLPYTLASMNPYTAAAMGIGLGADKFIQEFEKDPDKSLFRLGINAAGTGAIEVADAYLTRRFLRSANVLGGSGKKAAEKAVNEMQKGLRDKVIDVIGVGLKEGATEIGQAILTRINDRMTFDSKFENGKLTFNKGSIFGEIDENGNIVKGSILKDIYSIIDEGIIGTFTGGGVTTVGKTLQSNQTLYTRAQELMMPATVREKRNALLKEYNDRLEKIKQLKGKDKDGKQIGPAGNPNVISALKGRNTIVLKKLNEIQIANRLILENITGVDLQKYSQNVDAINALIKENKTKDITTIAGLDKVIQKEINELVEENNNIFNTALTKNYGENITFAEVAAKQLGFKKIKRAKNTNEFNKIVKDLSGQTIKDSSGVNGVFIGKGQIVINEDVALKLGAVGVGSHEILHPILNAMIGNTQAQQTIVEDFRNTLTRRQRRWTDNEMERQNKVKGTSEYYQEYITVFSEGLAKPGSGLTFDLNFGESIKEFLTSLYKGKGFKNIDFRSGRGVYNFLKAYDKSIKDGKLNKDVLGALDLKAVKEAKAIGDNIQKSEISNKIQNIYETKGFDGALDIINEYEGMANKHAQRFRDVPGFATMKDILVDDILTGRRGVIDLIRSYNPGSGVPLAAYINKFLPSRVIEIANRNLDTNFAVDITEQKNISGAITTSEVQEQEQRPSLRLSLNLTQDVIDKVRDAVIKTFGTRLPDIASNQFKKKLISNYKTFLKPTINSVLGTDQSYRNFLDNNFKLIYDILPQSTINRRFAPFAEPVVDENGKQLRERTQQGNKIFKKKKITKQEFIDYFIGPEVKASTRGARKTALSESLAQEIAFDATLDVLRNPAILEKVKVVASMQEIDIADNYLSQVASKIDRGVDFQFSKEANNAQLLYEIRRAILDNTIQEKFPNVYKQIVNEAKRLGLNVPKAFKGVTFEAFQVKVINDKASDILTARGDGKMGPTGTDIRLIIETKNQGKISIPVEVKLNGSDQAGSGSIKVDELGNFTVTNKQLFSMLPDVAANLDIYIKMHERAEEIQGEEIPFKFPQTEYDLDTWNILKKEFSGRKRNQRIVFEDASKITKFYRDKGIEYIYIGNKGLYYMGQGQSKLNVPVFNAKAGVYISLRSSGTRADGKVTLVLRGSNFLVNKGKDLDASILFSRPDFEKATGMLDFSKESQKLDIEFNNIIEQSTGIDAAAVISPVIGRKRGKRAKTGIMNMFIPYGAEDFQGLMYQVLPKGEQGNKAFAWMKNNLFRPFGIANENIDNERAALMSRWKELKKKISNVPKQLRNKTPDGVFTFEDAIRVYIWNKQGMDIPGLTKSDNKMLNKYVFDNKELRDFARQLLVINGPAGYVKPSAAWDVGNITLDLQTNIQTNVREYHLKKWQENINAIFTQENYNKLEAAFGANYVDALQNILKRMKTGNNRLTTGNKSIDNYLIWLNSAVGNIMFLNRRSSVLQLISNVNYINWSDNNILRAGAAFANQPQYWKDFVTIFNSSYLQNRRGGNRININENEIAEMANKGGVQGAISYLLDKGFILTRIADSFAIASGGATMYRNRIKTYEKQGLSEQEAQEKAFTDFRELTEEAQQSSRPDRISAQQASIGGRILLAFANTPMQYNRLMKRAIQDLANGRGDWKTNMSKIAYYGFVQNFFFNAMQQALIAMGFDDDVDTERERQKYADIANQMADSILRGSGFMGNFAAVGKNMIRDVIRKSELSNPKYFEVADNIFDVSPPVSSKYKKLREAGYTFSYEMKKIKSEGLSFENPANMAIAKLAAAGTNIPFDRAVQTMDDVMYMSRADVEFWKKIMIALGWPAWQLDVDLNKKEKRKNPWGKNTWGKKSW